MNRSLSSLAVATALVWSVAGATAATAHAPASAPSGVPHLDRITSSVAARGAGQGTAEGPEHNTRAIKRYVNLGDSYSAGTGIEPLASGRPAECRQAAFNHAHVLAALLRLRLTDVSCSGADTADFFSPQHPGTPAQLDALDEHTDLVTMMIGGNDGSVFSRALTGCSQLGYANAGLGNPCERTYGATFEDTVRNSTYPALVKAFTAVREAAPRAKVAVLGYPRLLPETHSCFPQMLVATGDVAYVNRLQRTLNSAVERAARQTGVTYVDTYRASFGHDACKPVGIRWVEPVIGEVTKEKAHPNVLGELAFAALTRRALHLR